MNGTRYYSCIIVVFTKGLEKDLKLA